MDKKEIVDILNASIRGTPISFNEKLIPIISEYLIDINYEKSDKLINYLMNNPDLVKIALPRVFKFYVKKYNICILQYKNQILGYYE